MIGPEGGVGHDRGREENLNDGGAVVVSRGGVFVSAHRIARWEKQGDGRGGKVGIEHNGRDILLRQPEQGSIQSRTKRLGMKGGFGRVGT